MKNLIVALILILAVGAGALYFTASGARDDATAAAPGASPLDEDYDYYAQNMRATRFGSDGQPVSQLQAERVTHYPEGDRAELQAPAFRAFGVEDNAWQVSAQTGTLTPDVERAEDRLELQGDVQLYKPLAREDFVDVRTSMLTVFTASEEVVNTAPVTLQMRNSRHEGVGLHALLTQNILQLNDGNGTHDPKSAP
jgi:lipopolysaccharide export system protein LptC